MNRWQWLLVAGALGVGVLAQIPRHDHDTMSAHVHEVDMASATPAGLQQVTLNVTGMT